MLIGYVRTPRGDKAGGAALAQRLGDYGCTKIVIEYGGGPRWRRPKLKRLMDSVKVGDVVVVLSLDHLSWSLPDVLQRLEDLELAGVGFRALSEGVDTTTPAGRMMMLMVGSLLDFERSAFRSRTLAGLEDARKAGRVPGPPPKLSADQKAEIIEKVVSGAETASQIARRFGVHPSMISRLLRRRA